jgi:hypothetical protein
MISDLVNTDKIQYEAHEMTLKGECVFKGREPVSRNALRNIVLPVTA